jgi:hypothetical protein
MGGQQTARFRWISLASIAVALGLGGIAACGSDEDVPAVSPDAGDDDAGDGSSAQNDGASITDAGTIDPSACADATADAEAIDCTGKCGPVKDPCTGVVRHCGGCPNAVLADGGDGGPRVCDLATNRCTTPKVTCADLGAECGTIKNSCGEYLDCPDGPTKGCGPGLECDPDTHKCRECQPVTCKDLGYECGRVWLGCGENVPENYTDCGSCPSAPDGGAMRCNPLTHTCEPNCRPKSAKELCDEAKAKKGLECGTISDGCGGQVNCDTVPGYGCPAGESCGVRGIANRCDPKATPDECRALGRNCGEITSACTGQKIKCGECPEGQVCNANGVCGAPCTPKTCKDFPQFECGVFDDGCGSTVTCGCQNGGICNEATHTCCSASTCSSTYAGQCGQDLPNGCGQNVLDCNCSGNQPCTVDGGSAPVAPAGTAGICCTPRTASYYTSRGQCGRNLPNGCGQNNVTAICPNGGVCVNNPNGNPGPEPPAGTVGSCCTRTDTCEQDAGLCAPVQNSCRTSTSLVSCNSQCTGGTTCRDGVCCTPAPTCQGNGGENAECNITKTPVTPGCGSNNVCNCTGNRTCWCGDHACTPSDGPGVCKSALTCNSPVYRNKCGVGLDNGIGGTINCGCGTGTVCSTSTPGALGTCVCANGLGRPYTCNDVPGGPGVGPNPCGTFDNGCGGTITCPCPGGLHCNESPNPNVCCEPATCPATPGIGTPCGPINNGCTTVNCSCPSGPGNENFTCTGGVCQCIKDTCRGRTGPQPDRCGGILECGG